MTPTPPGNPYAEWEETLNALATEAGVTMLLGGTDVGKTTFARLLVNRLLELGKLGVHRSRVVGLLALHPHGDPPRRDHREEREDDHDCKDGADGCRLRLPVAP